MQTAAEPNALFLSGAGMPSDLAQIAATGADETEAVMALRDRLNAGATFVVLSGGVGTGKSTAAAWWLHRTLERLGRSWMRWVHANQIARLASFDSRSELEAIEGVDFLVIDDLGLEYLDKNGWLAATLDHLVYQRHGNRRLTVATTNLKAGDFKARYGERVADRIRECGVFVEIAGKSLRRPVSHTTPGGAP